MRKHVWVGLGLLLAAGTAGAQQYLVSTVAGGGVPPTPAAAVNVGLQPPLGAAVDAAGNVYFSSGNSVFKIDGSGILTRAAGIGKPGYAGDGGQATAANLNVPQGLAVDAGGNLYIADTQNHAIRKVTPAGMISTVAGSGVRGYASDTGPATSAQLALPGGVAVDAAGDIYIADTGNHAIRKVTPNGVIGTVAGNGLPGYFGDGGKAIAAQLNSPQGVAVDAGGNLYIADTMNDVVREVTVNGPFISTIAGNNVAGYAGDGFPATTAQLYRPYAVAVDAAGDVFIADWGNSSIREVFAAGPLKGTIATLAGDGHAGYRGDGGPAASAELYRPTGIALDAAGDVFVADSSNLRVREISLGLIATVAGTGAGPYSGDGGPAALAQLSGPRGEVVDSTGNVYFADTNNNAVRKLTVATGVLTTVAGTGTPGFSGDWGLATAAQLNHPQGVALDSSGNLYISDTSNQRVRLVTAATGIITTVVGTGVAGYSGNAGPANVAQVSSPRGLAFDKSGNLFIADFANNVIREVYAASTTIGSVTYAAGAIVTVAGAYNSGYAGDTSQSVGALLNSPSSVALDSSGNLYIADSYNNAIRKVTVSTGIITTVVGDSTGNAGFAGDGGAATSARLSLPQTVTLDAAGDIVIADTGNNRIRVVGATSGTINTVAGNGVAGYSGDLGAAINAEFEGPAGVVVDSTGNYYIADTGNNLIRLLEPTGAHALLAVSTTHSGDFAPGQTGVSFSILVSNASAAGATSGTVSVTDTVSAGLVLVSMSGAGWTCSANTCTRSDALSAGSAYPAIAVTMNVAATTPLQVVNQVAVTGGNSPAASASQAAVVLPALPQPALTSPANGVGGVSLLPVLSWSAVSGATSYDVYFGAASPPPLAANVPTASYSPAGPLNQEGTYYWQVVARNSSGLSSSPIWSFTTGFAGAGLAFVPVTPCRVVDTRNAAAPFGGPSLGSRSTRTFAIPQGACGIPATAQAYSLNVTVQPQGPLGFLTVWPAGLPQPNVSTLNAWTGGVVANAAIVPAGAGGAVNVYATDPTDVIIDVNGYFALPSAAGSLAFYTVAPCRVSDTRNSVGVFGGPEMSAGETRNLPIPSSPCGIPVAAGAYSLNVTVVPDPNVGHLWFLAAWPAGQSRPGVSTLNSWTGKAAANAAIVPAGSAASTSVFVTDPTAVILDTNGYFAPPGSPGGLSFYPVAPCRVADTRNAPGPFGGPELGAGMTRSFAIPASGCYVPSTAVAYSLNITVAPDGLLEYLSVWPAGSPQPFVSTLNSWDGSVVANAAIVPAGTNGAISVFVTDSSHVIVDINGYFAP